MSFNSRPHLPKSCPDSFHVIVSSDPDALQGVQEAGLPPGSGTGRLLWTMHNKADTIETGLFYVPSGGAELAQFLDAHTPRRKSATIWLARGWEDLIACGLAHLMDEGQYRYRWCCLDGARCIVDGILGSRRLKTTSLAAWTGGAWDEWRDVAITAWDRLSARMIYEHNQYTVNALTEDVKVTVGTVAIVIEGCKLLTQSAPRLSIGAQARRWWTVSGGPLVNARLPKPGLRRQKLSKETVQIVIPCGSRPPAVVGHEAHCCHGLAREQYYRGRARQKVYVVDAKECYLWTLATTHLPLCYSHTVRNPPIEQLSELMEGGVGCALVLLDKPDLPASVYRHDAPARAKGVFWTWLCGEELTVALQSKSVRECQICHLYHAATYDRRSRNELLLTGDRLDKSGVSHLRVLWRMLYSSIVGSWAQRHWEWQDDDRESQCGRWATWTMAGREGEPLDHWRVVAGRVQKRVYLGESTHSFHLAYALITSAIRCRMDMVRSTLSAGSVLATACDSFWLTADGWRELQSGLAKIPIDEHPVRVKDILDDAYLDGHGSAVAVKGNKYYPLLPGVPGGVALDAEGRAAWDRAMPWTDGVPAKGKPMPKRRRASWDGGKLVSRYDHDLEPVIPWLLLSDPVLPESLLLPYDPRTARRPRPQRDGNPL